MWLRLDDGLHIGVEHQGEHHHVGAEQQPDVDQFEVGSDGECHLDAGDDGDDDQHEGEGHHHSVLEEQNNKHLSRDTYSKVGQLEVEC